MFILLAVLIGVALTSFVLTGLIRWYAVSRGVIDTPNERSSHKRDTPTGGGIAIVLPFLFALLSLNAVGMVTHADLIVLAPACAGVALVGFWDDHAPLSPLFRFVVQLVCASWVLVGYGFPFSLNLGVSYEGILFSCSLIGLVWFLNLYNFMDGIDGIASVEAISVAFGWIMILLLKGDGDWLICALVLPAVVGFLPWNWPPAKIFMGDAGSVFLGMVLGCLAIRSAVQGLDNLYVWAILLALFIVDATTTIFIRIFSGHNPLKPHRTHAYQVAAALWGSHFKVTAATLAINLGWLLPVAMLVALHMLNGVLGVIIAYAPLLVIVLWLGAGRQPEPIAAD